MYGRKDVKMILKNLYTRGKCHNMDIFINSSILLSASENKQYFEVDYATHEKGLVLHLISNGRPVATIMENNIESITVYISEE